MADEGEITKRSTMDLLTNEKNEGDDDDDDDDDDDEEQHYTSFDDCPSFVNPFSKESQNPILSSTTLSNSKTSPQGYSTTASVWSANVHNRNQSSLDVLSSRNASRSLLDMHVGGGGGGGGGSQNSRSSSPQHHFLELEDDESSSSLSSSSHYGAAFSPVSDRALERQVDLLSSSWLADAEMPPAGRSRSSFPSLPHLSSSTASLRPSSSPSPSPTPPSYREPVKTDSGLLLTHRQAPPTQPAAAVRQRRQHHHHQQQQNHHHHHQQHHQQQQSHHMAPPPSPPTPTPPVQRRPPNAELDYYSAEEFYSRKQPLHSNFTLNRAKRMLSYTRIWLAISTMALMMGTATIWHHSRMEGRNAAGLSEEEEEAAAMRRSPSNLDKMRDQQIKSAYLASLHASNATLLLNNHRHNRRVIVQPPLPPSPSNDQIILVPLQKHHQDQHSRGDPPGLPLSGQPDRPDLARHHEHHHSPYIPHKHQREYHNVRRVLLDLKSEFEAWMKRHNIIYRSSEEQEHRFNIWSRNHHRTKSKNAKHGPCKLTNKAVFGSNMFKDLTPEEFGQRYLTGYHGPRTDELELAERHLNTQAQVHVINARGKRQAVYGRSPGSGMVLDPSQRGDPRFAVTRHPEVQKKYEVHLEESPSLSHVLNLTEHVSSAFHRKLDQVLSYTSSYSGTCIWYDVSCWVRWFFKKYLYGIGGTMEPTYDADTYPSAVDWRTLGAVTDIHSQGNCGACWAITAVETVESVYYISQGSLLDLAETEVIMCDDSCEMCSGGWPQNAYEYIMNHKGLPLESDLSYDGDLLLLMTYTKEGVDGGMGGDDYQYYMYNTCPSGGGGGGSGSGGSHDDNENQNYNGGGGQRYGNIKGYGYSTDRCVCYTDGTGCDCNDQNEKLAIMNIATYGPAAVCLDASLWQDYAGGIITSDLGCSQEFLDMNHCVQVVGYAFYDADAEEGGEGEEYNQQQSGSGKSGGSKDDGNREGYWIVRNQWSDGWGMNGYAYVEMGANTCGILNDMTQAYM